LRKQKQEYELKEDFNKLQNETKETIKNIYEIKKTAQEMKEELNKDMEKSQKNESNKNPGNKKFLKSNKNIQLKAAPTYWNKWKTEFQG
jgi:hypothetical protein